MRDLMIYDSEIRLTVIDSDRVRRRLVCEAAAGVACLRIVSELASPLAATAFALDEQPDLFLISADLLASERQRLDELANRNEGAYFVLFSTQPDLDLLLSAGRLPVHGFLAFNHLATEEFTRSLQVIARGGAVIEPLSAQLLLEYVAKLSLPSPNARPHFDLSEREIEVLSLVQRGLSNKEIAFRLHISLGTVRAHLRSIFRKLDVRSRAGAAVLAVGMAGAPRLAATARG